MIKINRAQRYVLNGAILSLSTLIIRGVSVSFNIYLTSKIGAEGMGLIALVGSVYGLFITLATSGINLAVTHIVSASYASNKAPAGAKGSVRGAVTYAIIFSVTAAVILFVSAESIAHFVLKDERCALPLRILAFTLTPIALSSVINGYFCGRMQIHKNVAVSLSEQLVKIGLSALLLSLTVKKTVYGLFCAVIFSGAAAELFSLIAYSCLFIRDIRKNAPSRGDNFFYLPKTAQDNTGQRDDDFYRVFTLAFPVGVSAYVRSALTSTEHIAIPRGLEKYGKDKGYSLSAYGTLHGMVLPLLLFPSGILGAFSSLLIPELSSASARGERERISRTVSSVMGLSLLFSMGVAGIFIAFAEDIGFTLYGSAEASEYIRLLAPLIPLMYLDGAVDSMLKGLGEQLYCMRVNICDSLISIALIFTLLPRMGIKGYVCAVFITELLNASLSIIRLLNVTGADTLLVKWVIKPLFSVILSTSVVGALSFIPPLSLIYGRAELLLKVILCALFYIIISRISGAISKSDVKRMRGILDLSTLRR